MGRAEEVARQRMMAQLRERRAARDEGRQRTREMPDNFREHIKIFLAREEAADFPTAVMLNLDTGESIAGMPFGMGQGGPVFLFDNTIGYSGISYYVLSDGRIASKGEFTPTSGPPYSKGHEPSESTVALNLDEPLKRSPDKNRVMELQRVLYDLTTHNKERGDEKP